jgi:hypothetical protein|tara:strand:- start:448 stop:987 length:540 start_codon:yes stop_codon:yes gene_type:complete
MATVYEIVQGLSQAAANAYDGALDENGEPLKAGLQREDGDPILDKRIMDGFNVKFYGNMMCIGYHSEVQLKEVYANGFESDVEKRISDIASFLKKEYKKLTGNSVTLTKEGEVDVRVENSSRVRSWVMAKLHYKVSGLEEEMNVETGSKAPTAYWQDFLSQGGWTGDGGKRPNNDTRKK